MGSGRVGPSDTQASGVLNSLCVSILGLPLAQNLLVPSPWLVLQVGSSSIFQSLGEMWLSPRRAWLAIDRGSPSTCSLLAHGMKRRATVAGISRGHPKPSIFPQRGNLIVPTVPRMSLGIQSGLGVLEIFYFHFWAPPCPTPLGFCSHISWEVQGSYSKWYIQTVLPSSSFSHAFFLFLLNFLHSNVTWPWSIFACRRHSHVVCVLSCHCSHPLSVPC